MWDIDEEEDDGEPELEIRFPRILPESGWKLVLESAHKVKRSVLFLHTLVSRYDKYGKLSKYDSNKALSLVQ